MLELPSMNKWTREQRLALHILFQKDYSMEHRTQLFNYMFREELTANGLPSGLRSTVLRAQYYERLKNRRVWDGICTEQSHADAEKTKELENIISSLSSSTVASETSSAGVVVDSRPQPSERNNNHSESKSRNASAGGRLQEAFAVNTRPVTSRIPYQRQDGSTIFIQANTLDAMLAPSQPILDNEVRLMQPGLLFRFWSEHSQGINSEEGFVCGRFAKVNSRVRPAPASHEIDITDIELHVDCKQVATPFISTSNNLLWTIRNAMKADSGRSGHARRVMVSIMDADIIASTGGLYWMQPFQKELKRIRALTGGAWHYQGLHEYIVWHKIPCEAMLSTFKLEDFVGYITQNPVLAGLLRLDFISRRQIDLRTKIIPELKKAKFRLDNDAIHGITQVLCYLGLRHTSPIHHIQHALSDIIRDWGFNISARNNDEWDRDATIFANTFPSMSWLLASDDEKQCQVPYGRSVSLEQHIRLKAAFLYGVRSGLGPENLFNPSKRAENQATLIHQANQVNLAHPDAIISSSLQRASRILEGCVQTINSRNTIQSNDQPMQFSHSQPLIATSVANDAVVFRNNGHHQDLEEREEVEDGGQELHESHHSWGMSSQSHRTHPNHDQISRDPRLFRNGDFTHRPSTPVNASASRPLYSMLPTPSSTRFISRDWTESEEENDDGEDEDSAMETLYKEAAMYADRRM